MESKTGAFPAVSIAQANALMNQPGGQFELETVTIDGLEYRTFKNAPRTLRDTVINARAHGDKESFIYQDERVSYEAFYRAVMTLANIMRDKYGVKKGDRVAICMRNYPQWPVATLAALSCGAMATPLNAWWTGEELQYGLENSGAQLAILCPQIFARVEPHLGELPALKDIIIARADEEPAADNMVSLESLIGGANDWKNLSADVEPPAIEIDADDECMLMYTSGTTGHPKGAVCTNRAFITSMFNSMSCQARGYIRNGEMPPVPQPDDPQRVFLMSIPFFHTTGFTAVMMVNILRGAKMITQYKWNADEALEIIQREKVQVIGGVPTIAWQIVQHPRRDEYDLSSVMTVSYGGAPAAPELVTRAREAFPGTLVGNGWGMTETCATATLNFGMDYVHNPKSAGAAAMTVDLKIVDANGNTLGPNEPGELCARGANVMKRYWQNPEATEKTLQTDGWLHTGDVAKLDEEGFLYLLDRAKDMLIRGGENIYCVEVEDVLMKDKRILDAAIVGVPHQVLGEEVGAVILLEDGAEMTSADVTALVREHLAAFKAPNHVCFVEEPLPRNAAGKVLKGELRKLFIA